MVSPEVKWKSCATKSASLGGGYSAAPAALMRTKETASSAARRFRWSGETSCGNPRSPARPSAAPQTGWQDQRNNVARGGAVVSKLAMKNYWLVKQEPEAYSWDDFVRDGLTKWTGVRNFEARNNLRAMRKGDAVLFYHSVSDKAVV